MISKNVKSVLAIFAVSAILFTGTAATNQAYAGFTTPALRITVSNIAMGSETILIPDNSPLDGFAGIDGVISVALTGDNFLGTCALIETTTGTSKPILGNVMMPHMDIGFVITTLDAVNGCDVVIEWTDIDFEGSHPVSCVGSIGGTTQEEFSDYRAYAEDNNFPFGQTQQLFSTGILLPQGQFNTFGGGGASTGLVDAMYGLTMELSVSHAPNQAGRVTSGDAELICEPSRVAGMDLPINNYSLILAGLNTSLVWILPAVITVGGAAYFKFGRR